MRQRSLGLRSLNTTLGVVFYGLDHGSSLPGSAAPTKGPVDGHQVAAYKVQRCERPAGNWSDVATAMERAGEGQASNSVMAML